MLRLLGIFVIIVSMFMIPLWMWPLGWWGMIPGVITFVLVLWAGAGLTGWAIDNGY